MSIKINSSAARRIALNAASGFPPRFPQGVEGVFQALREIGYVQIDTINVFERAHHHVFFSRIKNYKRDSISLLELENRRVFEYWAHAAAYLPIEEYRFCLPRMARIKREGHEWFESEESVTQMVLERIRAEGPLESKDFADPRGKAGTWWDWKPAKIALERLFHAGELLVITRNNFRKVFDLAERILPAELDTRYPDEQEMAAHLIDRAANAYGIFTKAEAIYQRKDGIRLVDQEIAGRVEKGSLIEIEVGGIPGQRYYTLSERLHEAEKASRRGRKVFILSPFDPFIIDRKRIERLFDFSYSIECYLPAEKRQFGYFSVPILFGDSFAGRMDIKSSKADKALLIQRLKVSVPASRREAFCLAFKDEVERLAEFTGALRIVIGIIEAENDSFEKALRSLAMSK